MVIYSHTVTHTIETTQAAHGHQETKDIVTGLGSDYDYTFGRRLVSCLRQGRAVHNAMAGEADYPDKLVWHTLAKVGPVSNRDLQQSHAFIRVGDTKFHVTASECSFRPKQGDILTDDDGTKYDVLAVDDVVFRTRYRLWCRNSA